MKNNLHWQQMKIEVKHLYPNNIASTQTVPTKGKGAAVKGNKSSKRLA